MWMLKGIVGDMAEELTFQEMLRKECDLLQRAQPHEGIVRCEGLEDVEGYGMCLVMEYISGKSLAEMLEMPGALSEDDKRRVLSELLDAVEHLHKVGIIHCDLKPENIMLTEDGCHVKLVDFGLADAADYLILKANSGTPQYMPPERKAGGEALERTDIYAIGKIIEALNLGGPYAECAKNCLQDKDMRYANVEELRRSLDEGVKRYGRRKYLRRIARYAKVLTIVAAVLALLFFGGRELLFPGHTFRKGDTFSTAGDYLKHFGITNTDSAWGKTIDGYPHLLVWGPEYHNTRWGNKGDESRLFPTITEHWEPAGAPKELVASRNKEHHWMYWRLDELRLAFMKNFVDSGYVFLGVYRMAPTLSDTTKVVWKRVAEEFNTRDLDEVMKLRSIPQEGAWTSASVNENR